MDHLVTVRTLPPWSLNLREKDSWFVTELCYPRFAAPESGKLHTKLCLRLFYYTSFISCMALLSQSFPLKPGWHWSPDWEKLGFFLCRMHTWHWEKSWASIVWVGFTVHFRFLEKFSSSVESHWMVKRLEWVQWCLRQYDLKMSEMLVFFFFKSSGTPLNWVQCLPREVKLRIGLGGFVKRLELGSGVWH